MQILQMSTHKQLPQQKPNSDNGSMLSIFITEFIYLY